MVEPTIFDLSSPGRGGGLVPDLDVPGEPLDNLIPGSCRRKEAAALPEVSEQALVRHFVRLSTLNHHVDKGFYPLGSCTMKYNPKVNEVAASLPGFASLHPLVPESLCQGSLGLIYDLERILCEITGMKAVCMQPAAGAQGELLGLLVIRAFHESRGRQPTKVLVPDTAHGTNPASVVLSGFEPQTVPSTSGGEIDLDGLAKVLDEDVAALMVTNPNTLGLFERQIVRVAEMVHDVGGKVYMDGANMNALMGIVRPGDLGMDAMHLNLHKTFSTPHGGGGPGSGPVAVVEDLEPFLPVPRIVKGDDGYRLEEDFPKSVGRLHTWYGNFLVMVKAYAYLRGMGPEGVREVSAAAILNANYAMRALEGTYDLPYQRVCQHEFVLSARRQKAKGVRALDIAKRLLDYGFHAPTMYFPLVVEEALMIEPTETESKETLDAFIETMEKIAEEVDTEPDAVKAAPTRTPIRRVDEAKAARQLDLRWKKT
ncbi:MAG: aminomethyl-transferring glycine dehydrogenase subunit GcvPB [Candidatus Eisenbacteria sp.]|nr:aminomethyl-transferring glycine dehydrogenase subunit GcvPB [Candidatus Eisenbacteria bacterium]